MNKIKNLFSTPKKGIVTSVVVLIALAIIGTGTVFAIETIAESNSIGKEKAQTCALSDAGIDSATALLTRTEFERENGQYVYEVEFSANGVEYEYTVSAKDGAIIAKDNDGQVSSATQNNQNTTSSGTTITAEQSKEIALQHASLTAADVTFVHAQLDSDDGVQIYDVEFYKDNIEYDYEIDAATGNILNWDSDAESY